MSLIKRVRRTFGIAEGTETHKYECGTCYARFDVDEEDPSLVACESCGSNDVRKVSPG